MPGMDPDPDDQAQLSKLGSQLQAEATESPERAAYLKQLKAQVMAGTYKIDSEGLSREIVKDAIQKSANRLRAPRNKSVPQPENRNFDKLR